jgi:hypothetical protein
MSGSRSEGGSGGPSSPVCYAEGAEANPLSVEAIIELLNELLEGERAGAQGLTALAARQASAEVADLLCDVARDEGRFCAMLNAEIRRLGGTPTTRTGVFLDKLLAREGLPAQLDLLDRGQGAVARMILAALPRIADAELVNRLDEMYVVHMTNIRRCADFARTLEPPSRP